MEAAYSLFLMGTSDQKKYAETVLLGIAENSLEKCGDVAKFFAGAGIQINPCMKKKDLSKQKEKACGFLGAQAQDFKNSLSLSARVNRAKMVIECGGTFDQVREVCVLFLSFVEDSKTSFSFDERRQILETVFRYGSLDQQDQAYALLLSFAENYDVPLSQHITLLERVIYRQTSGQRKCVLKNDVPETPSYQKQRTQAWNFLLTLVENPKTSRDACLSIVEKNIYGGGERLDASLLFLVANPEAVLLIEQRKRIVERVIWDDPTEAQKEQACDLLLSFATNSKCSLSLEECKEMLKSVVYKGTPHQKEQGCVILLSIAKAMPELLWEHRSILEESVIESGTFSQKLQVYMILAKINVLNELEKPLYAALMSHEAKIRKYVPSENIIRLIKQLVFQDQVKWKKSIEKTIWRQVKKKEYI